ncbi:unnamed protein product [Pneumocystis jirovecii]|uniref:UBX domain-containing protein n=1 Tax=Pneumocystis jirovecii TaxID=42068 RepID=L0PA25_PNEJI|nr:unnamed protein product [Pneumocystis jirovecii]
MKIKCGVMRFSVEQILIDQVSEGYSISFSSYVGDIYDFMDLSNNDSRDYILQTTFPNKEYRDRSINLKDAGLLNAVLIQKSNTLQKDPNETLDIIYLRLLR